MLTIAFFDPCFCVCQPLLLCQFAVVLVSANPCFLLLSGKNGLKGQKDLSPGQRPGKKEKLQDAPHRGKRVRFQSFAPVGRYLGVEYNTQGVALG